MTHSVVEHCEEVAVSAPGDALHEFQALTAHVARSLSLRPVEKYATPAVSDGRRGVREEYHTYRMWRLIERPDGSRITVIVNIRPLKSARGDVAGAINCFSDITARKRHTLMLHTAARADLGERRSPALGSQVVGNLLSNACESTDNGGCIRLTGELEGRRSGNSAN